MVLALYENYKEKELFLSAAFISKRKNGNYKRKISRKNNPKRYGRN